MLRLLPLTKYNKKNAKKQNWFPIFSPLIDTLNTNLGSLNTQLTGVSFAYSKKQLKRAATSNSALIYYQPKGLLYFNHNGKSKKFGLGGVIAVFKKRTRLTSSNFDFTGGSSAILTSSSTAITDASQTPSESSYLVSASSSQVDEGDTLPISIKYSNVKPGTFLFSTISGVNSSDIKDGIYNDFATNSYGSNSISLEINADQLTEGNEVFTYKLYSDIQRKNLIASSDPITINDTSTTKSSFSISTNRSVVNEGSTVQISITTKNVNPGTNLYDEITGIESSDILENLKGNLTTNYTGKKTLTYTTNPDNSTEGDETFVYNLYSDISREKLVARSEPITIKDTSKSLPTLKGGESTLGKIDYKGEKDYYLLDIPAGHKIIAKASGEAYPVINIVNSWGKSLSPGLAAYDGTRKVWSRPNVYERGEDPVYAEIYGYGNNIGDYKIEIETDLGDDLKMKSSPELNKNNFTSSDIKHVGERDFYKFTTKSGELAVFTISTDANTNPLIDIMDHKGEKIASSSYYNGTGAGTGLIELPSGTFFLRVTTQNSYYTGDYKVRSDFTTREELKKEVFRLTNLERTTRGLTPLVYDDILESAAQSHVEDMESVGKYLAHTGSNGSSPGDRIKAAGYQFAYAGENAAYGQSSAKQVVDMWMNSRGHRAAILRPATEEIGVGFEIDDASGVSYWIQKFGVPL